MALTARLKPLIRQVTPPFLLGLARRARARLHRPAGPPHLPEWEYIPEGWRYAAAHPEVRGWNAEGVLATYRAKWPRFHSLIQGAGPLGVGHESGLDGVEDVAAHNTVVSFGYALALAAGGRPAVSLLDWGGGIGHYALLARALLPGVAVEYHCKDVPRLAAAGRELLPGDNFHDDEGCLDRTYDLVLASGSLHFSEDWDGLLRRLARAARGYLLVTRLPTIDEGEPYVFVQRPYAYGYDTEYLGWCVRRDAVLAVTEAAGLALVRELVVGEQPAIAGAPSPCRYRGFLFRASPPEAG